MTARITSMSFYSYGDPQLAVTITTSEGSSSFTIKDDDLLQIQAQVWAVVERKKHEMAAQISAMETPIALLAGSKIIDDEIPF